MISIGCDWSQNYVCKRHTQIQVMHVGQNQRSVSVHTEVTTS